MKRDLLVMLASSGVAVLSGCLGIYALGVAAGQADVEKRLAESNCGAAACGRERWRVLSIGPSYVERVFDGVTDRFPTDPVTSASRNRADGRLAVTLASGALLVAPSDGERPEEVITDGPSQGLSWCNSGELLAIVTRSRDGGHRLQLLDGTEFTVISEWAVELEDDGPLPSEYLWRFVLSWSAGDTRIVVSNDDFRFVNNESARPGGFILTVADGSIVDFPSFAAYFIDDAIVTARLSPAPRFATQRSGQLDLYTIVGGRVELAGTLAGPQRVVASDPTSGVFVAVERASPSPQPVNPLALRTLDAGPDLVSHDLATLDETIVLIPRQ